MATAQVFSCQYCKIFKGSFFHRTPPMAASDPSLIGKDSVDRKRSSRPGCFEKFHKIHKKTPVP